MAFFLYQGQIQRQKEGTSGQTGRPTCGNSVNISSNIASVNATEKNEVHKVLKRILTTHFARLTDQLKPCLQYVAAEMYSHKLISKSVWDSPTVHSVIDEFENTMHLSEKIFQSYKDIVNISYNVSPVKVVQFS